MAPLVVLCALLLLATLSVCLDTLRLNDIARSAVRSAITSESPSDAATAIAQLSHVSAVTVTDELVNLPFATDNATNCEPSIVLLVSV